MTDNRLRIFVAVAESGSFTAAAHRLGMSQPAVSQSVAQTEADAGTALLVRGRGEVSLTPAGRSFYAYAIRILSLYDSLSSELSGTCDAAERARLDIGDGRFVDIYVRNGKIEMDIKNN